MKRSLIIAALLGTTMLTPKPAYAMPQVIPFIAGAIGAAGGAAIATTAAYAAGAAFASSVIGGFIIKVVVAVGLSALAAKLSEKSVSQPPPSSRMVNYSQPISYAEHAYGRTRKGGPLGFTGFQNSRRYYVPILAAHPIEGIVEHWLDDTIVTLTGETDNDVSNIATAPMGSSGRIDFMDGGAGQIANAGMVAAFADMTSDYDFKGLSGAVIWAARVPASEFQRVYSRGREWAYAPVLEGNNQIYDPRDDSTGYSNNAALVMAHWQVNVLGNTVDWDRVAIEANIADTVVTNAESESQALWTLNGSISDDQDFEDQRAQMAISCDAFLFDRPDGKVDFYLGRWMEPTVTLTLADFWSHELTTGGWGGNVPDEVASIYTEPENAWRETPSGTWVHRDVVKPIRDDPRLYMCTNHNQASRVNRRLATMKNAEWRLRGTLKASGYELLGQRFFRFVNAEMGIDQYFEVGELAREGAAQFSISAVSVEPEDFAIALTEPTRPVYQTVTSNDDIPDVTGLGALAIDGGGLDYSWDAAADSLTQQVRIRQAGETDWQTTTVPDGQNYLRITGLLDGATYEAQARSRTAALRPGDWTPETPFEAVVVENSIAPAALESFQQIRQLDDIELAILAPNDANYFATRFYRTTDSSDFGDATLIRTEFGIASNSDSWTDVDPGAGTHRYWAIPVNSSGVPGPTSGPETVTI